MGRKKKDPVNPAGVVQPYVPASFSRSGDGAEDDDYVGVRNPDGTPAGAVLSGTNMAITTGLPGVPSSITIEGAFGNSSVSQLVPSLQSKPQPAYVQEEDDYTSMPIMDRIALMNGLREVAVNEEVKRFIVQKGGSSGEIVHKIFMKAIEKELAKMIGMVDDEDVSDQLNDQMLRLNALIGKTEDAIRSVQSATKELSNQQILEVLRVIAQRFNQ